MTGGPREDARPISENWAILEVAEIWDSYSQRNSVILDSFEMEFFIVRVPVSPSSERTKSALAIFQARQSTREVNHSPKVRFERNRFSKGFIFAFQRPTSVISLGDLSCRIRGDQ